MEKKIARFGNANVKFHVKTKQKLPQTICKAMTDWLKYLKQKMVSLIFKSFYKSTIYNHIRLHN